MELVISLLTAFFNFILGIFVFLKNPKGASHRLLSALTVCFGSWSIANYFSLFSQTPEQTLFWIRMVMFVTSPAGLLLLFLAETFPEDKLELRKSWTFILSSLSFLTAISTFTPFMFSSVSFQSGNIQPSPGPAIVLYAITLIGYFIAACIVLIKRFLQARGLKKTQLKFFIAGIIATFLFGALTNFVFLFLLQTSRFMFLGPTFSLVLVGFVTYAIIKHRLFDIRLVVARTVSWALLLTTLEAFYIVVIFGISYFLTGEIVRTQQMLINGGLAFLIALTFQPLRRYLEGITDDIFFKDRYETEKLLNKVGGYLSSSLDLNKIAPKALETILKEMKIKEGAIVIVKKGEIKHVYKNKMSFNNLKYSEILQFLKRKGPFIFDEMEESKLKEWMRKHNAGFIFPLRVEKNNVGLLILDHKLSGDIYFEKDIEALMIMVPEIAVAVQNALSFEEIKKFSQTLEKEVNEATQELQKANKKLKQVSQLKDDFVSMASHELRSPLTIINGYLSMLADGDAGDLPEQAEKLIDDASQGAQRMIRLVNNMLNVSRIESGRLDLEVSEFNLEEVCKEIVERFQIEAKQKDLELKYTNGNKTECIVKADLDKIKEVIINLVSNAIKYTDKGKVIVRCFKKENKVRVEVEDTGPGINKEAQSKLFKKFSRLETSEDDKKSGTGLGLYISKLFIERMGGKIGVNSEPKKGATFYFTLPSVAADT